MPAELERNEGLDRQFLYAIFAVQLGLTTPNRMVAAVSLFLADQTRDLAEILFEQGDISEPQKSMLEGIVAETTRCHDGDARRALHSLGGDQMIMASFAGAISMADSVLGTFSLPDLEMDGEDTTTISAESPGRYAYSLGDRDQAEVARGGIGRILKAIDKHLGREIAVKELLFQDSEEKAAISKGGLPKKAATVRFLREARVTGQLEHPSIVPVYELGQRTDGTLYYTMKLVRGQTMASLLEERKTLEERLRLLPAFSSLCNAIAYAHSRGVIHRDIKPANVMLGEFGETLVLDWGLAKVAGKQDLGGDELQRELSLLQADAGATVAGTALGTPAYMAPEQARGSIDEIDARSDVWSLGAVLYELLTGQPPYSGSSAYEVIGQASANAPVREPRGLDRQVPAALAAICMKACTADKQARYPSAAEMARDLEAYQTGFQVAAHSYGLLERLWLLVKRHKVTLSLTAAAMLLVGVLGQQYYINLQVEKCAGAEAKLNGVWDQRAKTALRAAFVASGRATAADTYDKMARLVDDYAAGWVAQHADACKATHERGEQSDQLLDLRMRCLDRRLGEIGATVSVFSERPDTAVVDRAVEAASKVFDPSRLEACADTTSLLAAYPPPADPDKRRQVEAVQQLIDRSAALEKAGKFKEGLALADQAISLAEPNAHPPALARALRLAAYLQNSLGKYEDSATIYRRAATEASRARDDQLLARIRIEELRNSGYNLSKKEAVPDLEHLARSALARAGDAPLLQAELENGLFAIQHLAGQYKQARDTASTVLAILERINGRDHPRTADALNNLGLVYINLGDNKAALDYLNQAKEVYERTLGADHPYVAYALYNIATIRFEQGDYDRALTDYEATLAIFEKTYGPQSPNAGQTRGTIGSLLTKMGRHDEADKQLKQAFDIQSKTIGEKHPYTLLLRAYRCSLQLERGNHAAARDCFETLLGETIATLGPEHPDVTTAHLEIARAYAHLGQASNVRQHCRQAIANSVKSMGADHPKVGSAHLSFGEDLLLLDSAQEAEQELRRALPLLEGEADHQRELTAARFHLACSIWQNGGDKEEALRLAKEARAHCEERTNLVVGCSRIDRWLAER